MSVNKNKYIRCRENLKDYENQRIKFIGYLKSVNLNNNIQQKIKNQHNALFVDVHGTQTITDNPNYTHDIHIELDHVHCQLYQQNLKGYADQFVIFTADVESYQSKYQRRIEKRYGLKNISIQSKMNEHFKTIQDKYQNELTIYQGMVLNHIIKDIFKKYPNQSLNSLTNIKKNLFRLPNFIDRTNFLIHTNQNLADKKPLNDKKMALFTQTNAKNQKFDINQYYNLQSEVNQLKVDNELHQQKLLQQKIQYQSQIKQYQQVLQQQEQKLKFYQTVDKYLNQPRIDLNTPAKPIPQKDDIEPVSTEQLNQLQAKFNQE